MTIEKPRTAVAGNVGGSVDADLIAGLWEEAPFPRLPWDAPAELRDLVDEVENPRRVYAVHQASRRHNFQLIVQMYIVQLRDGCGTSTCSTSTCLSFRQRLAGKAPLRRYSSTSARTLAIHLASQDNPEAGLCPALKLARTAPAALNSLIFSPKYMPSSREDGVMGGYKAAPPAYSRKGSSKDRLSKGAGTTHSVSCAATISNTANTADADATEKTNISDSLSTEPTPRQDGAEDTKAEANFTISDKPVNKDYRSFAANMFGTVAFKMLEWLTPAGIGEMTENARRIQGGSPAATTDESSSRGSSPERVSDLSPQSSPVDESRDAKEPLRESSENETTEEPKLDVVPTDAHKELAEVDSVEPATPSPSDSPLPTSHANAGTSLRNSGSRMRSPTTTRHPQPQPQAQPQRKLSVDPFASDTDDHIPNLRSPLMSGVQGDSISHIVPSHKTLKTPTTTIQRPLSQLSNAGFFDGVSLEKMPPLKASLETPSSVKRARASVLTHSGSDTSLPQSRSSSSRSLSSDRSSSNPSSAADTDDADADADADTDADGDVDGEDAPLDMMLPQTLTRLNADIIDFICDVLQDDETQEKHMLEPSTITQFHKQPKDRSAVLKRKKKSRAYKDDGSLRKEWRMFIEQSLFYVLSDPRTLLRSFTKQDQLYDTQTLWYCMLRLTRVAPSIVLHSLWVAAKSLLVPSKTLLTQRLLTSRLTEHMQQSLLTDVEAGMLMSICMHALVAVAPVVKNEAQLYDMSRIRSQGLSLAGSGLMARQPAELCLQYDDAFSNDLALRLAKLLFSAITAQRAFNASGGDAGDAQGSRDSKQVAAPADILTPLFAQLDFLNFDAAYILNFSFQDRAIHETRVPTLLLDWARAVMLDEWSGSPVVPGDGHFGGALALIEAIHENRHALLVGDVQFRSEYFAERLDEVEMPVAWLTFNSTAKQRHLLDFPFMFNPTSLVSYFRSINFSRMNRAFEESSSLQSRMNAIISPGSLIINPHHKKALQDLLKMASTKYLVLDIDRDNILQDAFDQLWRREQRELLRPLKVRLGEGRGEEGIDSGGVQHEFFRLALTRALDPDYGVFAVDGRTHMAWFNPTSLEAEWKFELIGLLVSLALFNGISLPVTFPKALYRKLLGEPVKELHHIADGWPDLVNGLTTLLEWNESDGAVEDVFVRTYEFSVDVFGQPVSRVMGSDCAAPWPNIRESVLRDVEGASTGASTAGTAPASLTGGNPDDDVPMVTGENRNAYVADYIQYLTDVSVRAQYEAFARGFRKCLHPKSLRLLTPALLQSLLEGEQDIDMDELQQYTRYVGWDTSHKTVRDFWAIVSEYGDPMKRKLLEFVTASDRMPVGGAKTMQFVLQRNGEEGAVGGHLPTAYTCYGIMLLPEYPNRQVLKERLAMALENSKGFGFS
ncbi:hypothetical protein SCUCBS95973_005006 [Sporothrix curviconia]|uniref:HECT-type E3 ubiquitin transferase n=1 Tax=Sporothrix curviconia TaxID=1260050 RepID=A0ABP0BTG3_9PEZI